MELALYVDRIEMPTNKDAWDKLDIVLKPLGGIVAGVSVAAIGYFGSQYLREKEVIDADARVFAQIMSQREDADSNLRMNMFKSIFEKFYNNPEDLRQQVLSLELLSYNFHEALDLAPLFQSLSKALRRDLKRAPAATTGDHASVSFPDAHELIERLERVAQEINLKQATTLSEDGFSAEATVSLDKLMDHPEGLTVLDQHQLGDRWFKVEVLESYPENKELKIKLTVYTKLNSGSKESDASWNTSDTMFTLGFFDFPMIDNTRLSDGKRAAVILREWSSEVHLARIQLVYFRASRASLKDKLYYDELIKEMLKFTPGHSGAR